MIELNYRGIDHFNRPVFKDTKGNFYGSVDQLYSMDADLFADNDKLHRTLSTLVYFGSYFGCEPMGTPIKDKFYFVH